MRAMVYEQRGKPLTLRDVPLPQPQRGQVRIKVHACGVCRTDLHILDQEIPSPALPLILGHQIVGTVETASTKYKQGQLVGVPWLGKTCGHCFYCTHDHENLCDTPTFTGYTQNGGFAEYCVADEQFIFPLPAGYSPEQGAPLLCAGMIGYRALKMAEEATSIGFYGFGAAAHLLIQVCTYRKQKVYVFTRKKDAEGQKRALEMGAVWAKSSEDLPDEPLDAALLFAPVGSLIPQALKAVRKGGKVISVGIHMTDIPSFPYRLLWEERVVTSVANLTRKDWEEFLALAPKIPIKTRIKTYPLDQTNLAIEDLRGGKVEGTAVIIP